MRPALVELILGADFARLARPRGPDRASRSCSRATRSPGPEALAAGGVLGFGDHAWVRTDALRRLAGPAATPEWEEGFAAMLDYARTRGWVDDEQGAVRGHVERRAVDPGDRRERRPGVSGELRDAVLLSFDNLGEAADLERGTAQRPIGDDPSVTVGLPRALEALAALDLRATFFVEGLNAELYPQALRDIAAAGHEVGAARLAPRGLGRAVARPRRTSSWAAASPRSPGSASRSRASARRAARSGRGRSRPWPPTACAGARRRASAPGARRASCRLPFRWPAVDAYHRLESFTDRRTSWGDRADVASPREAADALIGALDARGDDPLVLILHPFLLLDGGRGRAGAAGARARGRAGRARGALGGAGARARGAGGLGASVAPARLTGGPTFDAASVRRPSD